MLQFVTEDNIHRSALLFWQQVEPFNEFSTTNFNVLKPKNVPTNLAEEASSSLRSIDVKRNLVIYI